MGLVKSLRWPQLTGSVGVAEPTTSRRGDAAGDAATAGTGGGGGGRRKHGKGHGDGPPPLFRQLSVVAVVVLALLLCFYVLHSSWVASEMYSSPSIVLSAKQQDGSRVVFDDFREVRACLWPRLPTRHANLPATFEAACAPTGCTCTACTRCREGSG